MAIAKVSPVAYDARASQRACDASAARGALVPVVASPPRLAPAPQGLARPDPSFVTHLIAMAELSPQTRRLRRAAPADAQAAYRAAASQYRSRPAPGPRIWQIA